MEYGVIAWLLFGFVSAVVAANKGRNGCGWFLLGVLLGPFGLILSLVVPKDEAVVERHALESGELKKCPFCAELIKAEAIKCRFCGTDLPQPGRSSTSGLSYRCAICGATFRKRPTAYYHSKSLHRLRGADIDANIKEEAIAD